MDSNQLAVINKVIKALGGLTKIAKRYGITVPAVQQWRVNGIPKDRVKEVAKDSGVPAQEILRHLYT